MKFKILTFSISNNYGALLQSLYLKTFLSKKLGSKVEVSNFVPFRLFYRENLKNLLKKDPFKIFENYKKIRSIKRWKKLNSINYFPNFFKKKIKDEVTIYGSDEIWNFSNPFFGYNSFYFGASNKNIKIAYAVSIGNANIENISKEKSDEISSLLKSFNLITVRDQNTSKFVNNLSGKDPIIVVGPTLLINEFEEGLIKPKKIEFRYALIYGTYFPDNEKEKILNYCQKRKLTILSVGYFNNWVDKNVINADPNDFLNYIINSSIVFTSMFHGVIFSTKFNKQFWISMDPYRRNKLSYFLEYLDLNDQIIQPNSDLERLINYENINTKLYNWIEKSKKILRSIDNNGYFN